MATDVKLTMHTKEVVKSIEDTAAQKMYEATQLVRTQVLETLSGQRSGRTYYVPGTKRTYTASSPGEPPAVASSDLFKSITAKVESKGKEVTGYVGTDKIQGLMTEFGTVKMAARPWLRISFEQSMDKLKSIFGNRWF